MFNAYRRWISPLLHSISGVSGSCRFQPTCSEYAEVAFARHGMLVGSAQTVWRLLRCNPFGRGGFDPVPGIDTRHAAAASQSPTHPHR